jgi:hypothetical protein
LPTVTFLLESCSACTKCAKWTRVCMPMCFICDIADPVVHRHEPWR